MIIDYDGNYVDLSQYIDDVYVRIPIRADWQKENLNINAIRGVEGIWYIEPTDSRRPSSMLIPKEIEVEASNRLYHLVPARIAIKPMVVQHKYLIRYWRNEAIPIMHEAVVTLEEAENNEWRVYGFDVLQIIGTTIRRSGAQPG